MGLECPVRISKSCFCDPHEVCPVPRPFPLQEALTEAVLDLCQGKLDHGRGTPEDTQNVVFSSYAAHRDTFDGLIGRRSIRRNERAGHTREFCMALVRESSVEVFAVLDGDPGCIPERFPDLSIPSPGSFMRMSPSHSLSSPILRQL